MKRVAIIALVLIFGLQSCDKNDNVVLFFGIDDDIALGKQVRDEIASDPSYNLLRRADYPEAYSYLDGLVNDILNSGEVAYKDEFEWEVTIIDDDVLNAFATPGGYIYVYTGLIKYLDNADALIGVLGHEVAHADLRHSSRTLQKQYGVQVLLSIALGNSSSQLEQLAGQLAGNLAGLQFSREYETESDLKSVEYLAETQYACDGAKLFFQKLEDDGQSAETLEFLSTHPNPDNRIENIEEKADEEGCDTSLSGDTGYTAFQNALP